MQVELSVRVHQVRNVCRVTRQIDVHWRVPRLVIHDPVHSVPDSGHRPRHSYIHSGPLGIMSTVFSPTPAELNLVSQIFAQHDPQKLGILTGDVAVRVFGGAKLLPTTLGEIWNIADEDNNGWLPKKGVAIAVRLIGWGQKGEKITQALVNKRAFLTTLQRSALLIPYAPAGPLAVIDGINVVSQQSTGMSGMSLPKSPPPISFPVLTPQDKAKFQNMFMKSGPFNGLLSGTLLRYIFFHASNPNSTIGEKARDIFVKSKLSNEQLLKIW
jgi:epidermal growth factor receptor substrate 15